MALAKRRRLTASSEPSNLPPISHNLPLVSPPPPPPPLSLLPAELVDYILDTHLVRAHTHPTTPENKSGLKALRLLRHRTKSKAELALSSVYGWDVDPNVYECWKVARKVEYFGERCRTYGQNVMKLYLQKVWVAKSGKRVFHRNSECGRFRSAPIEVPRYEAVSEGMVPAKCCSPNSYQNLVARDWSIGEWRTQGDKIPILAMLKLDSPTSISPVTPRFQQGF
ncbi:hypothetical protein HK104_004437 [Borealophlyctis nickersoniae]|nr:hypothetical protein HK104_004437 [Borealophlyctis nickersoniae]